MSGKCTVLVALLLAAGGSAALAQNANKALLDESRTAANQIVSQVRSELMKELERTGPVRAITVCKYSVPEITSNISRQTGMRVTRVALRPRNRALGEPDVWEQRVLLDFENRVAKGEKADGLEYHEVVEEPAGRVFRYMKALPMVQPCLLCHGPSNQISEGVRTLLATEYPSDKAVEYNLGQVRGAVSVKKAF
ncbi:DUF3365 domain-containing protein [Dechloromonas sp. XY25]|uniref:DUF3365 domain-containing protein n=1 Tax=Dechloromonas hankyongensis TaxID=2908002 RepID=A0ABS9K1X1_9RHOO|nr:DUF3365 domain-containing protein [Dechloromonas hankyongensis]MCG2577182.1 DUF3365 domain-containing protein [Dechloromonas hankyongensis]